ncbi:hypothetical protein ACOAJ8_05270 [Arcobacter cryaerophilus gv. pseudocryaerophilus]
MRFYENNKLFGRMFGIIAVGNIKIGIKMEEIERENNFKEWLRTVVDSQAPISSYPNALKIFIPNKLEEMNENIYGNLFNCTDLEYLKRINQRLLNNGDLASI